MAQKVRVRLVDDLDGSEAHETVTFALDGKPREIELSHENAARFRRLLDPFMEASRPAKSTNLAAKGTPPVTQAALREEGIRIREWADRHHLPINPLGRIPQKTRKAWEQHVKHGDRSLLDSLLERAGIDPNAASTTEPRKVVSIRQGTATTEDHLERQARAVGKLSEPQCKRLRETCAGDGTATAADPTDRSSYEALRRRGCMDLTAEGTYVVTDVGRTWLRLNKEPLSA
ncbi:histone-like nucleoid-structuring protein Lsr2 [Actinacidiphila sp. ITFR-21]|uniref:histone-like nucleoid-structuring protein Lsr2 n=1 Tax=Actinacidiphila sp. ITFR-21 TaxID=3075199 RepID=UPI00288AC54D|nr:Lsr2 family protein [Streptomyces sp. ITFR-21]WNI17690.1 Lsr2 family protein [Streptomyces sp. ITFR-21]WNI17830.1 Lsr2 family protein [Streptomyces sp. ITFR-21]